MKVNMNWEKPDTPVGGVYNGDYHWIGEKPDTPVGGVYNGDSHWIGALSLDWSMSRIKMS